eukprot:m.175408 g.175408  ORF g.175408 m.175408 type:complete len:1368 (-) comp31817_c1_seq2:223-4326(-)
MAVTRHTKRLRSYVGFLQARSPMHSVLRHLSYRALQPLAAANVANVTPVTLASAHTLPRGTSVPQTQTRTATQFRGDDGPKLGSFPSLEMVDPIITEILDPTVFVHPRRVFYAILNCQYHEVKSSQSMKYNTAIRIWKAVEQRRHNYYHLNNKLKLRGFKDGNEHVNLYALHPQSDHYEALIRIHLATNHPLDIHTIIADMRSKSVEITPMVQHNLLRIAAVGGESPAMIQKCMQELGDDEFSWKMEESSLITAYCKRQDFESAFDVLTQIKNRGENITNEKVFPIMVIARHGGNSHLMQRAIEECEDSDGKAHSLRYFSFAFHGFGVAGDLEGVKRMMVERNNKGFQLDVDREFAFYDTCFRGDFEDAADIAAQYVATGEMPRHETIKALLGAYQLRQNHRRSMELIVFIDEVGWKFTKSRAVWLAALQVFAATGSAQTSLKYIQHLISNNPEMYDEHQMSLLFEAIENNKMVVNENNPLSYQSLYTEWINRRELIGTAKEMLYENSEAHIQQLKKRGAICPTEPRRLFSRHLWERMVPLVFFHPNATESRLEKVKENVVYQKRLGWAPRTAATTTRLRAATDDLRYYHNKLRVQKSDLLEAAKQELELFQKLPPNTRVSPDLAHAVVELMFALDMTPEQVLRQLEDLYSSDRLARAFWIPYQPIVDHYLKNHEIEKVLDLMSKLKQQNVVFAPASFVTSFQECARTGDLDSALALLMLAREMHVPITEAIVLLLIDACCVAGDTRGLQGVTSLVAGKASYDPLGQRTWASIIVKISDNFGLEAAQEIYTSLAESGDVRFEFKDALAADVTVTTADHEHVEEHASSKKVSPSGRADAVIAQMWQEIQRVSPDVPTAVANMLEKIKYTGRVDMEDSISILKANFSKKQSTKIYTLLLDLYFQLSVNADDEDFEGLEIFKNKIDLKSAHVNIVLQHLTALAIRNPSVKTITDGFLSKVESAYAGRPYEHPTPHLRALNYYLQTSQVYQVKVQFKHLMNHSMSKDNDQKTKMNRIASDIVSMLIQHRDFKFLGELFDRYVVSDDPSFKFTDAQLIDFAIKLKLTQKIDASKFSQSLFGYIKNVDGTNTDYNYKLHLIQYYSLWREVEKTQMVYDKIEREGQEAGAWAKVFLIRAYTNDETVESMARAESKFEAFTMEGDTRAHTLGLMVQGYARLICDESIPVKAEHTIKFSKHMGELVGMGVMPKRDTLVAIAKVLSHSDVNKLDYFNKLYSKVKLQSDAGAMLRVFLKQVLSRRESLSRKSTIIIEAVGMRKDIDHPNFLFLLRNSQGTAQFDSYFGLLGMIAANNPHVPETTQEAHMFKLRHVAQTAGQQQLGTAVMEATQACRLSNKNKTEIRSICQAKGLSSPF